MADTKTTAKKRVTVAQVDARTKAMQAELDSLRTTVEAQNKQLKKLFAQQAEKEVQQVAVPTNAPSNDRPIKCYQHGTDKCKTLAQHKALVAQGS